MKRQVDVAPALVLESPSMIEVDRLIQIVAPKDIAISLSGESGTGKEVLAKRVHDLSPRREAPFVPINCAAIPEQLFESELFGHERGAFTGANTRAEGKLEAAAGGTLFLDEIGEMPLGVQAKLLRFLENKKFMRVGGTKKIAVDIRVITATLRPLEEEVRAGRFRGDLFYRIQGVMLDVPPLRERRSDIGPLIDRFIVLASERFGTRPPEIPPEVRRVLHGHAWPGNVRELRNTIDVLCVLCEGRRVTLADLPRTLHASARPVTDAASSAYDALADRPLDETVHHILEAALRAEQGNRSRAARRLGVSLRTMQRHAGGRRTP